MCFSMRRRVNVSELILDGKEKEESEEEGNTARVRVREKRERNRGEGKNEGRRISTLCDREARIGPDFSRFSASMKEEVCWRAQR